MGATPVRRAELDKLCAAVFGAANVSWNRLQGGHWHALAHGPQGEVRVWAQSELEVKRRLRDALVGLEVFRTHGSLHTYGADWPIDISKLG